MIRHGDIGELDQRLLDELTTIVSAAGAAILSVGADSLKARTKADSSPVTAADRAAETVILEGLSRALPGICVVSEEAAEQAPPGPVPASFVLVDPLDGTRELLAGRDEFTVNLALVSGGRPRLGIVAAPARQLIWRGIEGRGADRVRLGAGAPASAARERVAVRTRPAPPSGLRAAVSRSHLEAQTQVFLERLAIAERQVCGSALKFCLVAEGAADVYPRLSTTCEWDVAAGHALVAAAGGSVVDPHGMPLGYGRRSENFRLAAFVAWGDPAAPARLGL